MIFEKHKGFIGGLVNVIGSDLHHLRKKLRENNFNLVILNNKGLLDNGFSKNFGLCCFIEHKNNIFRDFEVLESVIEKEAGLYLICYKKDQVLFSLAGIKKESKFLSKVVNYDLVLYKVAIVSFFFLFLSLLVAIKLLVLVLKK